MPKHKVISYSYRPRPTRKIYVKCFLGLNKNDLRPSLHLLDSGSDICLVRSDTLNSMFSDNLELLESRIKPTSATVSGFSGKKVIVKGYITFYLSFSPDTKSVPCYFYIINSDDKFSPCGILGISSITYLRLEISNTVDKNGKIMPFICRKFPNYTESIESYFLNESDINSLHHLVTIGPNQRNDVNIPLPEHNFHDINDFYLIEGIDTNDKYSVFSSVSDVKVIDNKYYVTACICNQTSEKFHGEISLKYSYIDNPDILSINKCTLPEIRKYDTLLEVNIDNQNDSLPILSGFSCGNNESDIGVCSIINSEPTYGVNTIVNPYFPEEHPGYNPTIENNGCQNGVSLSDSRTPIEICNENSDCDFSGPDTINLSIKDPELVDINSPQGFELPASNHAEITAADIINLESYNEDVRPYIKDIFIDSYPDIVSLHCFDIGNISALLGSYTLRLRKGVKLPHFSKLYYLSPGDSLQLRDILQFMESKDLISKSPQSGDKTSFACPSYLVPKRSLQSPGRLVINYIPLNRLLEREAPIIPTSHSIIANLRDCAFFSTSDFSGAFNSISLNKDCRHLTQFTTPLGQYYSNRLITGGTNSPTALFRFLDKVLNFLPKRNKNGEILFETNENGEKVAQLEHAPLPSVSIWYDDLIIYTKFHNSYKNSLEHHFKIVKLVMERISIFGGKVSITKSEFFQPKIKFIGWEISSNCVRIDKKRIQKILQFEMPQCVKSWRSWIGVVNSVRLCLGMNILDNISILANLTSDKADHKNPTPAQVQAFETIKKQLVQGPLFSSIISSTAPKILYSDAAGGEGSSVGGVLMQVISAKDRQEFVEPYLSLADKCHIIIHTLKLPCVPSRYFMEEEIGKEFLSSTSSCYPVEIDYLQSDTLELEDKVDKSVYFSLRTLFCLHNMDYSDAKMRDISLKLVKFIKKDVIGQQIKTYVFSDSIHDYNNYLEDIKNWRILIDSTYYVFDAISQILLRPVIVISSLSEHTEDPIFSFRSDLKKPAFYFLIYEKMGKLLTRPAYIDKNRSFDISIYRGGIEIIAYYSHTIPQSIKSCHVMELEAYGLIQSLESFQNLIGSSEICLITDSKALYFLCNKLLQNSSDKIMRWCHRIFSNFPQLKIAFCKSQANLADFLTRHYNLKAPQFKLTGMQRLQSYVSDSLWDEINNKCFTVEEWKKFCDLNPNFLKIPEETLTKLQRKHYSVSAVARVDPQPTISRSLSNFINIFESIGVLKDRVSTEKIINEQRVEFSDLYNELISSQNFEYEENGIEYILKNGIILRKFDSEINKILLPTSMENLIISLVHLTSNHGGINRILANMDMYYSKNLRKKTKEFVKTCLTCLLNNYDTTAETFGFFNVSNQPFENIMVDYIEDLAKCEGYQHLLIIMDTFSLATYTFAFKKLTSKEFLHTFIYSIYQIFRPQRLYCDNSLTFINKRVLTTLASLKVTVLHTVPRHPYSHGFIEAYIKNYKTACKKFLSLDSSKSWIYLPPLISLQMNTSMNPRHMHHPFELIFGQGRISESFSNTLENDPVILHPVIKKLQEDVDEQREEWIDYLGKVQTKMNKEKANLTKKLNKGRNKKKFSPDSVIFLKKVNPRGLETVYSQSIFKLLLEKKTTVLITRLSDGWVTLSHKNNCKVYRPNEPLFNDLPQEVKDLCTRLQGNSELSKEDFHLLLKIDDFTIPDEIKTLIGDDPNVILRREFSD